MVKPTIRNLSPYLIFGAAGLLCGIGGSTFVLSHKFETLRSENIAHQNRIQLLGTKLEEQTNYAGALGDEAPDARIYQAIPVVAAAAMQQQNPPPERKKPKPGPVLVPVPTSTSTQTPAPRLEQKPSSTAERQQQHQEITSDPTESQQNNPPPVKAKKIDAISYQKADVIKLERGAVTLDTGRRIRIGEKFPSGEKLIFVDAANHHIVTDKRELFLFN